MNPHHRKAQRLLQKYLEGKCTPSEAALLHRWYEGLPEAPGSIGEPSLLEEKLRQAIWSGIERRDTPVRRLPVRRLSIRRLSIRSMPIRLIAAACLVGLLAGAGALWFWNKGRITVANDAATARVLTLPDGTKVWLNTHSTLSWRGNFTTNRHVSLEGEGYFQVAPDPAHPFTVTSRELVTKVLGTEFNIESYAGEGRERVALVKGSVQVQSVDGHMTPRILRPGQIASLGMEDPVFDVQQGDAGAYGAWTAGGFTLQTVPLELALKRLCHKYGYTLRAGFVRGRQKPITATFTDAGFEEILASILYINHLTYSIQDSVVTVR